MSVTTRRMIARYEGDTTDIRRKVIELNSLHEDMRKKTEAAGRKSAQHAEEIANGMNRIRMAYAGVAGLIGGVLAHSLVSLADSAKSVDNQLKAIGAGSDEARKKIYALAIETRTPLEATVGLMRSIAKSLPNQELDQTIKQVGTLNRLLTIGGLDAGARGSVVLQFGQALQSGVLSGDELRALRESAPIELMDAIAKRAGGTVETLRKLGEQQLITRDVMVGALEDLEQTAKDKFGAFDMTVGEAMGVFNTALVGVVGQMDDATQATATMADVIAGVAGFMTEHAGAAATLAGALSTVAQYALIAAGARGVAALTPVLVSSGTAIAALATGATTAAGAMTLLTGAAGRLMAMLGGPLGLAIFAATSALLLTSQYAQDFGDNMETAANKITDFNSAIEEIGRIQGEITSDSERLKTVNNQIAQAIEDQAAAAEATGVREKAVLEARIAQNRELLEVQRELARQALSDSIDATTKARVDLASRARTAMENFGLIVGGQPSREDDMAEIEAKRRALVERSQSGKPLNEADVQWLADYAKYMQALDEIERKQNQLSDNTEDAANAHVMAWRKQRQAAEEAAKAESEAISSLLEDYNKRESQLRDLNKQRDLAVQRLNTPGISQEDRVQALQAIRAADEQIAKVMNIKKRTEEARAKFDELSKAMAGATGAFDQDGRLTRLMDEAETKLRELEKAGEDASNVEMNKLEAALAGVEVAAARAGGEMQKIAEISFQRMYDNFDRMRTRLDNMGAPYADIVQQAGDPSTYTREYTQRRETNQGRDDELLVREATRVATEIGISVKDLLSIIMLESGGDPTIRGGAGNRHVGLIQFGQWEQQHYGVNQQTSIPDQMTAAGRFLRDRGVRPGDEIDRVYAAINAGHANLVNRGDTANGGIVGNIRDFTTGPAMRPYSARAEGLLKAYGTESYDTAEGTRKGMQASQEAADEAARRDKERAERQKEYLDGITDANEKLALEAELVGKTSLERQRVLRIHEEENKAIDAGMSLDERRAGSQLTLREEIRRRIDDEINLEVMRGAAEDNRQAKAEAHAARLAQLQDEINEKKSFQASIEDDINRTIVQSVIRTGDWRQAAGALLEKLAEALLMKQLFDDGPLGGSGGGGWFGAITRGIGDWIGGLGVSASKNGNVMTEFGPLKLERYARGGIARRPQLSLFGEGSVPEAYVPLPDGRSIPVTIREPEVPKLGLGGAMDSLRVELDLKNDMLDARIVDRSGPVAASVTRRGINEFSRNELPSQVHRATSDPKRTNF